MQVVRMRPRSGAEGGLYCVFEDQPAEFGELGAKRLGERWVVGASVGVGWLRCFKLTRSEEIDRAFESVGINLSVLI